MTESHMFQHMMNLATKPRDVSGRWYFWPTCGRKDFTWVKELHLRSSPKYRRLILTHLQRYLDDDEAWEMFLTSLDGIRMLQYHETRPLGPVPPILAVTRTTWHRGHDMADMITPGSTPSAKIWQLMYQADRRSIDTTDTMCAVKRLDR